MNLLVIGNGQTESSMSGLLENRVNLDLTLKGKKQAELMANWIKHNFKVNKIISSPLKQAYQTAEFLSTCHDIRINLEQDIGDLQKESFTEHIPYSAYTSKAKSVKPSETLLDDLDNILQFRTRAENVITKLLYENDPESTIAIVGHSRIINMMFQCFMGLPMTCQVSITTSETGIHHWQVRGSSRKLVFLNSLVHLNHM